IRDRSGEACTAAAMLGAGVCLAEGRVGADERRSGSEWYAGGGVQLSGTARIGSRWRDGLSRAGRRCRGIREPVVATAGVGTVGRMGGRYRAGVRRNVFVGSRGATDGSAHSGNRGGTMTLTVGALYKRMKDALQLEQLGAPEGMQREITAGEAQSPGLALAG